ncbi:CdaR family transcriptional regulator [Bacillaceae bacterium C204]|uniref:CdaR family transcriptional regulator n=1 Tax=Neobacillus sp. 204 TaxID=3383351 RepID=UPI00397BAFF4
MLTREIAIDIVKETSMRLNRNINIMNEKGIIIASGDLSRIDDIHEGALEVIKKGRSLTIHPDKEGVWKGAQRGINLPIIFQDKIVGVIGITGNPDEMQELGGIVKMTTELMIKQQFIASQTEWLQRTREMIIEELLKVSPSNSHIERGLNLLEIKLQPPFVTFIIQMTERAISNNRLIHELEEITGKNRGLIGFININRILIAVSECIPSEVDRILEKVCRVLKKLKVKFRLTYSIPFQSLSKFCQSYTDCDLALQISDESEELISFAEIESKALIFKVDRAGAERFTNRIINQTLIKYTETLETFFNKNLNIQHTADELFIHRNTLIYRLNKIEEETGYDPKCFKDALTLQLAIWTSKKLKSEEAYLL